MVGRERFYQAYQGARCRQDHKVMWRVSTFKESKIARGNLRIPLVLIFAIFLRVCCSVVKIFARPARVLARPKPAKGARSQQAIHESIDDFLDCHSPRLTLPDTVAQLSKTVGKK